MKYLKDFTKAHNENDRKPCILYLHGLDGELNNKYKEIINKLGCNYIGISIDYKNESNILDIIRDIKVDAVIGHSLGGYLAHHISNIKKIPALLLMPSFDDNDIKYIKIPTTVKNLPIFKKKIILVGTKDKCVDRDKQLNILNCLDINEENINHDLSDSIFRKYSRIFIRKFIIKNN